MADCKFKDIGAEALGFRSEEFYKNCLTLADALGPFDLSKVAADSAALSDNLLKSVSKGNVDDSLLLGDTFLVARLIDQGDDVSLSDAAELIVSLTYSFGDGAALSDARALSATLARADALSLGDSFDLDRLIGIGDGISLSDADTFSIGRVVGDALGLGDSESLATTLVRGDSIGLVDDFTKSVGVAVGDGLGLADADVLIITLPGFGDSIALADSHEIIGNDVDASDTIALTDADTLATGIGRDDSLSLTDTAVESVSIGRGDGIDLTDVRVFSATKAINDNLNLTDGEVVGLTKVISDTLSLTDVGEAVVDGGGISIDKVTHGQGSGSDPTISITLGSTTTGRLLLCAVANEEGFNTVYASGCKVSGGTAMTEETTARATRTVSSDRHKVQLFWIEETSSTGATDFDITIANSDDTNLIVYEITGANNSAPIGAVSTNSSGGTDQTFSLTTTVANSNIICCTQGENSTASPAAGITEDIDVNFGGDNFIFSGHRGPDPINTYDVGCTTSGSTGTGGASWAVEIKAA